MPIRIAVLTALSLLAFSANSILSRLALRETGIDPASFVLIRLLSASAMLLLLVGYRHRRETWRIGGNWLSAAALVLYAVPFTFSYVALAAGTGALLSFGAVQVTMIFAGLRGGERLHGRQWPGLGMALGGILALLLPGATAPPLFPALLMIVAGIGWGLYSLRGKGQGDPLAENAGNFLRALPLAGIACLPFLHGMRPPPAGIGYALLSGVGASAVGYAIWYAALRGLTATGAATIQLGVPVLTALLSLPLLGESLTLRLALVSAMVLTGIALVVRTRKPEAARRR